MACFPRLKFPARQTNSFTPEKDENTDTVLNNRDSTVVSEEIYIQCKILL